MFRTLTILLCLAAAPSAVAQSVSGPRQIVEAAVTAQGGDAWLNPRTLLLEGTAVFYAPDGVAPTSRADDYRMWRAMGDDRTEAHGADGKVRIVARANGKLLFAVGYDGTTTWTEKGVMPTKAAAAFWASNFGFGIIRSALDDRMKLEAAPPRTIDGHAVDMVRILDAQGQTTLFGFDRDSHFIRYMGFRTPRGWHERTYDDFIRLPESGWVQARHVTLFYDGVMANEVSWTKISVGCPLEAQLFRYDAKALTKQP